jgi:hypothetical protein
MDITSTILQGVTRAQGFQASMATKTDAIALLTGALTGTDGAGAGDPLYQDVLQSSLLSAGGAAAVKLMAAQDTGVGQNVDVKA